MQPRGKPRLRSSRHPRRAGIAALEVVIATGVMVPALCLAAYAGFQACRLMYCLYSSMVGSPYM